MTRCICAPREVGKAHERLGGTILSRLEIDGVCLHDHPAEGIGRGWRRWPGGSRSADFHAAMGRDMVEELMEKLHGVEGGGCVGVNFPRLYGR